MHYTRLVISCTGSVGGSLAVGVLLGVLRVHCISADSETYSQHAGVKMNLEVAASLSASSEFLCGSLCRIRDSWCDGFSYNSSSGLCDLYQHTAGCVATGVESVYIRSGFNPKVNTQLALGNHTQRPHCFSEKLV